LRLLHHAYELVVTRTPDGQQFRLTAKPATEDFAARFPNADGGKPTLTLSSPLESPPLSSGNKFVIPIPADPGLDQTQTDTVRVRLNQRGATAADAGAAILTHSERGQLWVYHDAKYKPAGNWTKSDPASSRHEFFTAAADSIQGWLQ
jgi:hypothetical protein